jgi:hypothetical protein
MKIAAFVARHAAPGCREWAEGLAREAEFIKDDWSALRWAIGSTRVLLDRREAPMRSLADVAAKGRQLSELGNKEGAGYLLMLVSIPYLLKLLVARGLPERIGAGLVVVAGVYIGGIVLLQQRKRQVLYDRAEDLTQYCKLELERQREFLKSGLGRSIYFALSFYFLGIMFSQARVRVDPLWAAYCVAVWILVMALGLRRQRQVQRQIDEVDAVLEGAR